MQRITTGLAALALALTLTACGTDRQPAVQDAPAIATVTASDRQIELAERRARLRAALDAQRERQDADDRARRIVREELDRRAALDRWR